MTTTWVRPATGGEDAGTRRRARATLALAAGVPALVVGAGIGVPHALAGLSPTSVLGVAALVVGIVLLVVSFAGFWRGVRWPARVGVVLVAFLLAQFVVFPMATAVFATNRAPMPLPDTSPAGVGLSHRDVVLTTTDGVELAAWYVPSENGAAVVLRHGAGSTRANVLEHARVLAGHGFGVLMVDARGHGDSAGDEMDFGWFGDADVAAAVDHLARADDVVDGRIGVVGLSMGGEEAIGAAASQPRIRAVVAEGATGRTGADWVPLLPGGLGRWFSSVFYWVQDTTADVLSDAHRPADLRSAVVATAPRPVLLIAAGDVPREGDAARRWQAAAPGSVEVWEVDGAAHTAGLSTVPDVWERRVVGFLAQALDVPADLG